MLASVGMWNVVLVAVCILPVAVGFAFIAYLVYCDSQNIQIKFSLFPKLIPWTTQSRVRKAKAEVELERMNGALFEVKHKRLQQEMIYSQLEDARYERALAPSKEK